VIWVLAGVIVLYMEQQGQSFQKELASLSTNSVHQIVTGAEHADFWLDAETAPMSVAAVLQVIEATHTGEQLRP